MKSAVRCEAPSIGLRTGPAVRSDTGRLYQRRRAFLFLTPSSYMESIGKYWNYYNIVY